MVSISSESVAKMEDEVSSLLHLFNSFKMAGKSATLVLSTKGGKTTTAKLEVELSNNKAEGAEGRHRPQPSAAKRARANARAAQHRVHQALPFSTLLTAHHPLLDLLFVSTPPQLARTAAVLLPCLI